MVWSRITSGIYLGLKIVPHFSTMFARLAPIRLPEVYIAKECELQEKVIWTVAATTILGGSTPLCCPKDTAIVVGQKVIWFSCYLYAGVLRG